jgi:hypothetical protein
MILHGGAAMQPCDHNHSNRVSARKSHPIQPVNGYEKSSSGFGLG